MTDRAFTLIELLVVVTIIVVLLALLTPALDKAIYAAEMAVDAANQDGVGNGMSLYAMQHKRHYPYRMYADGRHWWPQWLSSPGTEDVRLMLRDYVSMESYNDPLGGGVDFDPAATEGSNVLGNYPLWGGFKYAGHGGMMRVGERVSWSRDWNGDGVPERYRFNLLVSDWDLYWSPNVEGSHADDNGVMHHTVEQNDPPKDTGFGTAADSVVLGRWTLSRWIKLGGPERGLVDQTYMYQDGSVTRYDDIEWNEGLSNERMTLVPLSADGGGYPGLSLQVPKK